MWREYPGGLDGEETFLSLSDDKQEWWESEYDSVIEPNPWQVLQKISPWHNKIKFICDGLKWEIVAETCEEPEPKDPESLQLWFQRVSIKCLSESNKGTILSKVV